MQHLKLPFYILFLLFSFISASLLISLNGIISVYGVFVIDDDEKEDSSKAKIVLIEQKYKSDKFNDNIFGQILNIGNGTAEFVQISFNLFNKKGDLIGTDFTYAEQDILNPGQKSSFNMFIDEEVGDKMKAFEVSLTWNNPDGTEEYVENVDIVEEENNFSIFQENKKSNKLTDEDIEKLGLFER
jgi:hypothetical protein